MWKSYLENIKKGCELHKEREKNFRMARENTEKYRQEKVQEVGNWFRNHSPNYIYPRTVLF